MCDFPLQANGKGGMEKGGQPHFTKNEHRKLVDIVNTTLIPIYIYIYIHMYTYMCIHNIYIYIYIYIYYVVHA